MLLFCFTCHVILKISLKQFPGNLLINKYLSSYLCVSLCVFLFCCLSLISFVPILFLFVSQYLFSSSPFLPPFSFYHPCFRFYLSKTLPFKRTSIYFLFLRPIPTLYLSVCLSVCVSLSFSLSLYLFLSLSLFLFLSLWPFNINVATNVAETFLT